MKNNKFIILNLGASAKLIQDAINHLEEAKAFHLSKQARDLHENIQYTKMMISDEEED